MLSSVGTRPVSPCWLERRFGAMGTSCHLLVWGEDPGLLDWAVTEVQDLELSWSRFLAHSELSQLNRSAGVPFRASPALYLAVERAVQLWRETGGYFDPTVLGALESAGYDRSFRELAPGGDQREPTGPTPGANDLVLDPDELLITLPPGVRLDLGGVGKGLAADLVATGLLERGAGSVCLSMGGDIRVLGPGPDDGAWEVDVEDPYDDGCAFLRARLDEQAVACSTTRFRSWERNGRRRHHLIDPTTGAPADRGVTTAVVSGPEAWLCEGWAKAALIGGLTLGLDLLRDAGLSGWLVDTDRTLWSTDGTVVRHSNGGVRRLGVVDAGLADRGGRR